MPPTARVVQRAEISVLPPIAQVGSTTAPSTRAGTVISTTFTPAVHGRPVVLARKHHGRWQVVDRTTTTRKGVAEFTARTRARGKAVKYRTTALAYRTLPKVNSSAVWSTTWGAPDFVDEFDAPALDARWQHRIQFLNPWGGRSCSRGAPEATGVESGALRLSVLPTRPPPSCARRPCRRAPWTAHRPGPTATGSTATSRPRTPRTSCTAWPRPG